MYGSLLFWVGGWNLLTLEYVDPTDSSEKFSLFSVADAATYWLYCFFGSALMLCTDTFYGNAGLSGGYYPPSDLCLNPILSMLRILAGIIYLLLAIKSASFLILFFGALNIIINIYIYIYIYIITYLVELLGLIGSMLIWVGIYQLFDLFTWTATPQRDSAFVISGFFLLIFTRTLYVC